MNPLYNAGIALYKSAAHITAIRSTKVRHMLKGQAETMDRLQAFRRTLAPEGFDVWIHAASLGEFEQGRPVIDALLTEHPETKILLTFFSPSGYEVRCDYDPRIAVVYLPFDKPSNVERFLDIAEPKLAIFVKYEFWGNYLTGLQRRSIPIYLISSIFRPGQIFFRPWGGMFRNILGCFSHIFVQEDASRRLLEGIGITNVTVAGDTRFDRVSTIRDNGRLIPEIETFKDGAPGTFTLIAGSSWPKDEDIYIPILKANTGMRAIIAPHEFDAHRLAELRRRLGSNCTMLLSDFKRLFDKSPAEAHKVASKLRYLIIDCFGLLSRLYRYGDAAYIGGGFGAGIHNINEDAVFGIPVIFGPNNKKFIEARELQECGGGFCIDGSKSTENVFRRMTDDMTFTRNSGKAAKDYIASKIGATSIIMRDIFKIDTNKAKP